MGGNTRQVFSIWVKHESSKAELIGIGSTPTSLDDMRCPIAEQRPSGMMSVEDELSQSTYDRCENPK